MRAGKDQSPEPRELLVSPSFSNCYGVYSGECGLFGAVIDYAGLGGKSVAICHKKSDVTNSIFVKYGVQIAREYILKFDHGESIYEMVYNIFTDPPFNVPWRARY